eukprot:4822173-Pyramimonas_sp.AAC.1
MAFPALLGAKGDQGQDRLHEADAVPPFLPLSLASTPQAGANGSFPSSCARGAHGFEFHGDSFE